MYLRESVCRLDNELQWSSWEGSVDPALTVTLWVIFQGRTAAVVGPLNSLTTWVRSELSPTLPPIGGVKVLVILSPVPGLRDQLGRG